MQRLSVTDIRVGVYQNDKLLPEEDYPDFTWDKVIFWKYIDKDYMKGVEDEQAKINLQ